MISVSLISGGKAPGQEQRKNMVRRDIIKIIVFLAVIAGAWGLTARMGSAQKREESAVVEQAIRSATYVCYAVEGAYPPDLDYLKEHYHLSYNEHKFRVTYDSFASNMMPDIYVVERGAG